MDISDPVWDKVLGRWAETDNSKSRPFCLGIPGEFWSMDLNVLVVPFDSPVGKRNLLVMTDDGVTFKVMTGDLDIMTDGILAAAAVVLDFIENYEGKAGDEDGEEVA